MNYKQIITGTYHEIQLCKAKGELTSYISELCKINLNNYGICFQLFGEDVYILGEAEVRFSIQRKTSVSFLKTS